jgi:glycosyltransferase involved in cell wall biosynthesis
MSAVPILFVNHTPALSGAELSLLSLIKALDGSKFAPMVVLPGSGPFLDRLASEKIPAFVLPLASGGMWRPGEILRNVRHLRSFVRAHGIRLIHANSFHAIKQVVPYTRPSRVPLVGSLRDIIPFTWLTRAAILACDRVVCVSEATALNLVPGSAGRRAPRVRVIHNGVDPGAFRSLAGRREVLGGLGLGGTCGPVVGMAAPLVRWKGQEIFLEAAAVVAGEFPDAVFLLAGGETFAEAGYVEGLRARAALPDLAGRIHLLGFRDRIAELLSVMDVVVCPSVKPDPLPRAVLDAMAAARPVVASNLGGIPEAVMDGRTGFLVDAGDPSALATKIIDLLRDEGLRRKMGQAGAKAAADRFSIATHCARVSALYTELLSP